MKIQMLLTALVLMVIAPLFCGCTTSQPAEQAYTVNSQGAVNPGTRSALDGSTAPGKQELVALYIPFPPFGLKAGIEWDGTTAVIPSPMAAPASAQSGCTVEQYYVESETYTEMVPVQKVRQVQRTRQVPAASIPLPPQPAPCDCCR